MVVLHVHPSFPHLSTIKQTRTYQYVEEFFFERRVITIKPKKVIGTPVGFFSPGSSPSPYPPMSSGPPGSPFAPPGQSPPPLSGGGPALPPTSPGTPSAPGLQGILQNLIGGSGSLDLPSIITNAQKLIGVINQAGTIMKNVSPILQTLQELNLSDLSSAEDDALTEEPDDSSPKKPKKRRKTKRSRQRNIKHRTAAKKRKRRHT